VYVSCTESNSVAVIDCQTDSVVAHIGVGAAPIKMYVNAPSRRLYVLNWDGECVSIVDLNTLEVRNTIPTGGVPNCFDFSIAGNRFYVGGIGDSVVMIDGETDSVVGYAPLGPARRAMSSLSTGMVC
jgi:YVTN family beta-propeller protein